MNLNNFLQTIRVFDENNQVSLTNISIYVVLIKLILAPTQIVDIAALLITILNYAGKKLLNKNNESELELLNTSVNTQIEVLKKEVNEAKALANKADLKTSMRG